MKSFKYFLMMLFLTVSTAAAAADDSSFLIGKWVPKGGTPYVGVYTFNKDNTFSYQLDDEFLSGKYSYKNGIITFKNDVLSVGDEAQELTADDKKPYELKAVRKSSNTIFMGGRTYKNIKYINDEDDWYGGYDEFVNNVK